MQVLFQSVERSMKSWISKDVLDIHGMGRTKAFKLLDALMKAQQEDYGASALDEQCYLSSEPDCC